MNDDVTFMRNLMNDDVTFMRNLMNDDVTFPQVHKFVNTQTNLG